MPIPGLLLTALCTRFYCGLALCWNILPREVGSFFAESWRFLVSNVSRLDMTWLTCFCTLRRSSEICFSCATLACRYCLTVLAARDDDCC